MPEHTDTTDDELPFDEPDADWTDDHQWTRWRGPQPYPVAADWVLAHVEGDGILWRRYPGIGEGMGKESEILDVLGDDGLVIDEDADVSAYLTNDIEGEWSIRDDEAPSLEQHFEIDGETVFRRVEPTEADLYGSVAEALARYSSGGEWQAVEPESGQPPEDVQREREVEARRESNQSLGEFEVEDGNEDGL